MHRLHQATKPACGRPTNQRRRHFHRSCNLQSINHLDHVRVLGQNGTVQKVRRTKCLGRVQDMTFHEAQREAVLFLSQPTNQKSSTTHTMSELIDHWRHAVKPTLKLSTQRSYEWAFGRITPRFGDQALSQIGKAEIQSFLTASGRTLSGKSVRDLRCWLRAVLSCAVEWQWIEANPAAGRLRLPEPIPMRPKVILNPEEFWLLVDDLRQPYRSLVTLAILSGLRKGEMAPLIWTDIRSRQVAVNKALYRGVIGTPKTRRSRRVVTIGQVVQSALADWRMLSEFTNPSDFVFAIRTNSPIDLHHAMARHIKPVCRKLGITDIGWHDLLHTYTTWGRRAGVPVEAMRDQLGHASSVLTLDVYSHAGDDRESAVQAIENYVQTCGKRNPSKILMSPRWRKLLKTLARSGGFEPPAFWSVARRSIQLSYERVSSS